MTRVPGGKPRFGPGSISVAVLIAVAVCLLLAPGAARAQCPPVGTYPAAWPSSWTAYSSLGDGIEDGATDTDQSYGTPPSVAWVDIYNGDSGDLPSLYWSFDSTNQVMFFRQRLRGDPRQHSSTDDYSQFTWTTNLDLNGDGFSDFLVQVNGFDDQVQVLYDADGDNVFDDALCASGGDMVFATATTTTTQYTDATATGGGHLLDWQLPLCALSDCDGTQIVTESTPFSLTFTSSTNESNPTGKDGGFPGDYKTAGDRPLPGGDPCSIDGTCTERPYIADRSASCSGSPTTTVDIVAKTLDALVVDNTGCTDRDGCVVDTIASVKFEYKELGTSNPWTEIATVTTPDTNTLNSWSTSWDVTGLSQSVLYWVRITVTDDDGNTNSFDPDNDGDVPGQFSINLSDCSIGSLPVSLAWVDSEVEDGGTRISWATATEAGNLGFRLYGLRDGSWHRIGPELVPSQAVDSVEPQHYELDAAGAFEAVLVEDVDIFGRTQTRGPFEVGRAHGAVPEFFSVDWRRVERELESSLRAFLPAKSAVAALRLLVDSDGIYRVGYEELAAAGLDLIGVPGDQIALSNRGISVPITVGRSQTLSKSSVRGFGPGWWVEFYGEGLDDLYTTTNVYQLSRDPELARRADSSATVRPRSAKVATRYRETQLVEHDRQYSFSAPNGDPWYDERLLVYTEPQRWSFPLEVDRLVAGAGTTTLHLNLWGWTDFNETPDHHVVVYFNGHRVADEIFDGIAELKLELPLPDGLLFEGTNTLEIELPGDTGVAYDLVAMDSYGVSYPRQLVARDGRLDFVSGGGEISVRDLAGGPAVAYRIDDDGARRLQTYQVGDAVRFAGTDAQARYSVATEDRLLTPQLEPDRPATDITTGSAEYLIISHPLFLDGLDDLIAAREADGFQVRLVDVDDVYAQFNHGIFGAAGISSYVAHAAEHMGTRFVLLVGGDTYDYFDHLGLGSVSFMPSPYLATQYGVSYAPVDPAYGDCDGDQVPELAVGRLPVRTLAELDDVISKILAYDTTAYGRSAVFAADSMDGEVSFGELSDSLVEGLGGDWTVKRAYIDDLGVDEAHLVLDDSINGGVALTSFVGHSGLTMWSFEGLFATADAVALSNHGWPTVVVQWGCWNTYHASPKVTALGDAFINSGTQGAAAVLGAASLTEISSDRALSRELMPLLATPGMTIGEAMVEAKRAVANWNPNALDVLLGWTLLGDPAMVIERR